MEDFGFMGLVGGFFGFLIGLIVVITLNSMEESKIRTSGQYLTYENVVYKKVSEEELDNIIILEVK